MSQHASFGGGTSTKRHRSVLKRYEKIDALQKKGLWSEENGVLGLPKVKVLKIKAKKEKAATAEGEEAKPGEEAKGAAEAPAAGGAAAKGAKSEKK